MGGIHLGLQGCRLIQPAVSSEEQKIGVLIRVCLHIYRILGPFKRLLRPSSHNLSELTLDTQSRNLGPWLYVCMMVW